jgi:hypothetical protein
VAGVLIAGLLLGDLGFEGNPAIQSLGWSCVSGDVCHLRPTVFDVMIVRIMRSLEE